MLDINFVINNFDNVKNALLSRGETTDLDGLINLNDKRKKILLEIEELRHNRNVVSQQIADIKKKGDDAKNLVDQMRYVSDKIKELDRSLSEDEATF